MLPQKLKYLVQFLVYFQPIFQTLSWLPLPPWGKCELLVLTFKTLHNPVTPYLSSVISYPLPVALFILPKRHGLSILVLLVSFITRATWTFFIKTFLAFHFIKTVLAFPVEGKTPQTKHFDDVKMSWFDILGMKCLAFSVGNKINWDIFMLYNI